MPMTPAAVMAATPSRAVACALETPRFRARWGGVALAELGGMAGSGGQ